MAGYEDLANKLKPFLANDKEFHEQVKQSVVLDVDTKDAQASFATIEKRIESLKKSVSEFGKGTQEAIKATKLLDQEAKIAISVIEEKYRQAGEQIKKTIAEIATNTEKLNFSKSGGAGKKSGLIKGLEKEQEQLKKQLESRKKLQEEYMSQQGKLVDSMEKKEESAPKSEKKEERVWGDWHKAPVYKYKKDEYGRVNWDEGRYYSESSKLGKLSDAELKKEASKREATGTDSGWVGGLIAHRESVRRHNDEYFKEEAAKKKSDAETKTEAKKTVASKKGLIDASDFSSLEEVKEAISTSKQVLDELRANAKNNGKIVDFQEALKEARELEQELKELEKIRSSLEGKQPTKKEQQQAQQQAQLSNPQQGQETSGVNGLLGIFTQTMKIKKELSEKRSELPFADDAQSALKEIGTLEGRLKTLKAVFNEFKQAPIPKAFINAFHGIGTAVKTSYSVLRTFIQGGLKALTAGVQHAMSGLKSLASNGFHAVAKGASVLKSGFVSVQKRMHSITKKATPNMLKSLTSIKSMLMRRVKRTFISAIFNQAKEGLNELAKHSESFNTAMSNIKNSAKESAGNLAVTLGSMVETIAPALQTLLGWFNQLLVAINSVFALLQGKKTVTVAKKSTDNYAKSLKSASGSAKDLNHQLYGFDEITRQEDNSGGGGGGKIGYAEQQVGDMYSDIANMLKEGKFREVGTWIGNQLTEITQKIDSWIKGMRPKAKQWARNIAEILNGLIDTDLFASIGTTVGDGLNLVMDTLYTFLTSFDFATFGKKIADGLNHLFDAVEWDLLGKTVAARFNAIYVTIANFVQNAKWGEWGKKLATTVTTFFKNFNWDAKRQAISGGINGIVELLNNFFTGVNWTEIAGQFAEHINGIFSDINWSGEDGISGMLSNGINSVIDIFSTLVDPEKGINFGQIATDIGTGVGDLLKNVNWTTLAEAIGDGIGQLVTAFGNLLTSLDLPGIAVKLAEGVNAFFDPQKGGATFETAISAVSTGLNGVIDAFAKLLDPTEGINFAQLSKTLADSINGLVKQTDWATLIETLLTLHIDIQQAFWDVVAQIDWSEIGTRLADGINGLFKDADGNLDTSKFEKLGKSIGDGVRGMVEGLSEFIGDVDLDAVLSGIFAFIESIPWTDIVTKSITTIAQFLSTAIDALPKLVEGIIGLIGEIDWLDVGIAILEGIAGVLVSAVSAVGGILSTIWEAIFGSGEEKVEIPKVLSDEVMNQLKEQMGEAGRELANTLNDSLIDSLDDAGSDYEAAKQLFLNSAAEIGMGFQDKLEKTLRDKGWTDDAIASLTSQIDAVYEACKEPSATIDSVKEAFRNNGIWITDGMAEAFIGQGSENIAQALQLMALGVDKDTIAALDISHLNENLTAYMNASGESIEAIAGTLGANVGQKIGGTVPEFINKALEEGKETVAATAEEVVGVADTSAAQAQAGQNATDTGETVVANLADGEESKKDEVEKSTSAVTKTIDDKIKELPAKEQENAKKMMSMMVEGILEGDPLVQTAIQNSANAVVQKVTSILSGTKGREVVRNFLDGMRSEIDETFATKVHNNLVTLSGQIVSAMATRLSKSNGYTIMYNAFAGMNEAISNNGQPLVNNFAKVIQALVDTAREVLDEHSPSKVFNQIGAYVMEGMALGIESTGSDAIGAVGDVAQAIVNEAENGDGIKFQIGAMADGMDVVTDKMERLAQVFSDIASTIAEMGGLEIPTVASGRVLPYRTQIGSAGSAEGATFDENALESTLYSAITRALGTGSGDRDINITLSIDGRKLSDIVTKYQRQQGRAWGV